MHHLIAPITVAAVAGLATCGGARQALRWCVRGGLVATRKLQALGATTAEQARKIVDEARADLDRQETERPG